MVNPGEIYLADLEGTVPHPVIIVSREERNRGENVLAVLVTSARFSARANLPSCVPFRAGEFGFTKDCIAQCENILLLPLTALHPGPIDVLDDAALRDVIRAIGHVLDADCEPT